MAVKGGNGLIATSLTRIAERMRPLALLFIALLLASSVVMPVDHTSDVARADSLPSWWRVFHLHDGSRYEALQFDWMNSSMPSNPNYTDYDGDTFEGITIRKNVPPQRWHHWVLFPGVDSDVVLLNGLTAHVWARSRDNESGSQITAIFFDILSSQFSSPDSGTEIGRVTIPMQGDVYSQFKLYTLAVPFASYTLTSGHFLVLTLQRGDSLNDGLIVYFDKTDYDSTVEVWTSTFISMDEAWTEDQSGELRAVFSDQEDATLCANVSNPFGAYEIVDARALILYAGNGTPAKSPISMVPVMNESAQIPYWTLFSCTLPSLEKGPYVVNVSAFDPQGCPSWLNLSLEIIAVDHFFVDAPPAIQAGKKFSMSLAALDEFDEIIENWVGNVKLVAYLEDRITLAGRDLANASVNFTLKDTGQVNMTDQNYTLAEQTIVIRASSGTHLGWSAPVAVSAGPVVNVTMTPSDLDAIAAGTSVLLQVEGRDSLENLNTTWVANWTFAPTLGTLVPNGYSAEFVAEHTGNVDVMCRNDVNGFFDSVTIDITPDALALLVITSPTGPLTIAEGESVALTAVGYDGYNNLVDISLANWTTNTSGRAEGKGGSATFIAGFIPEAGTISILLGNVVGTLEVQVVNNPDGPWFSPIPVQVRNEDSGKWTFSLTGYWHDSGGTNTLTWWVEGVNTSLFFISHDPLSNAVMQFYTQADQYGEDEFTLWAVDSTGYRTYQNVRVRILAVNDKPSFVNNPPAELWVRFDTPYTFDYDYYVSDVDNSKDELLMSSSLADRIFFDGLTGTFIFPKKDGETPYFEFVTMTLSDLADSAEMRLVVRVTSDNPPSLIRELPDIVLNEGVVNYQAFDLDDYFFDIDSSYLIYSTGFHHVVISIDSETHVVNVSAPEEWSGTTQGSFTATDPVGALKTDTINITVLPVNDFPIVICPGTVHVKYDSVYHLYLGQYVHDPDDSIDTLEFIFNDTRVSHNSTFMGVHMLDLLFPPDPSGQPYIAYVRMIVEDPDGLQTVCDFQVRVSDNSPPEVLVDNPDQIYYSFQEDSYLNDTIRLYEIFSDSDDSTLTFLISSDGNVFSKVYPNGVVNLTATVNWSGWERITIKAVDPHGAWASVKADVTVTEVNDAPVIMPIEDIINRGYPRTAHYPIFMYFYDSDDWYTNLTVQALPSVSAAVVGNYLFVSLPNDVDVITVTLQASDGELESNEMTFRVGVSKTIAERIGYPYSFPLVLVLAGVAGYFMASRIPRPHALENLFLIHNDGRLVAHVTKEENTNLDKDVVSAMFTAVQEFVRDSFQQGEVGLKKLEIGDKNVVIEKGKFAYLALIYSGWPPKEVFAELAMLLRDVEERFKSRLEKWNGTAKAVRGVEMMLQDYMSRKFEPGAWEEEEGLAEKEWVEILDKEA